MTKMSGLLISILLTKAIGCFTDAGSGGTDSASTFYDDKDSLLYSYTENSYVTGAKICSASVSGTEWVVGWQYTLSDSTILPYLGVSSSDATDFACTDLTFDSQVSKVSLYKRFDSATSVNAIILLRFQTTSGASYDSLGSTLMSNAGSDVVNFSLLVGSYAQIGNRVQKMGFYEYDSASCSCDQTILYPITDAIPLQGVSVMTGDPADFVLPYYEDTVSGIKGVIDYCGSKSYSFQKADGSVPDFASVVSDVLTIQSSDQNQVGEYTLTMTVGLQNYLSATTASVAFDVELIKYEMVNSQIAFTQMIGDDAIQIEPLCEITPDKGYTPLYSVTIQKNTLPDYLLFESGWETTFVLSGSSLVSDTSSIDNSISPIVTVQTNDEIYEDDLIFFDVACYIQEWPTFNEQSLEFQVFMDLVTVVPDLEPEEETEEIEEVEDETIEEFQIHHTYGEVEGDGPYLEFLWVREPQKHVLGLLENGDFQMLIGVNETVEWEFQFKDDFFEGVFAEVEMGAGSLVMDSIIDLKEKTIMLMIREYFPIELKGDYLIEVLLTNEEGQETEYNMTLKLWTDPEEVDLPPPFFPPMIEGELPFLNAVKVNMFGEAELIFNNSLGLTQIGQIADLVNWTFFELEKYEVTNYTENSIFLQLTFKNDISKLLTVNFDGLYNKKVVFTKETQILPQLSKDLAQKLSVLATVLSCLMLFVIISVFVVDILVFRRGECKALWQAFELWQLLIYLHVISLSISAKSVYFAKHLLPVVQFDVFIMQSFDLVFKKTEVFKDFQMEFQADFVNLNIMNYFTQPNTLVLNLGGSSIFALVSLITFLFVSIVTKVHRKLRVVLRHAFYVLIKSILLLPIGLSALLQLTRTDFEFRNVQTMFAIAFVVQFLIVIPIAATIHADQNNNKSLTSRHWQSMFVRVLTCLTLGLLPKYPIIQFALLQLVFWSRNLVILEYSTPGQTSRGIVSCLEMISAPILLISFVFDSSGFYSISLVSTVILTTAFKTFINQVWKKLRILTKAKIKQIKKNRVAPVRNLGSIDTTTGELCTENQLLQTLQNLQLGGQNEVIIEYEGQVIDNLKFEGSIQDIQFKNNESSLEISYGKIDLASRIGSKFKTQLGQVLKIPITNEEDSDEMSVQIDIEVPEQPQDMSRLPDINNDKKVLDFEDHITEIEVPSDQLMAGLRQGLNDFQVKSDGETWQNLSTKQFLKNDTKASFLLTGTNNLRITHDNIQKGNVDLDKAQEISEQEFDEYSNGIDEIVENNERLESIFSSKAITSKRNSNSENVPIKEEKKDDFMTLGQLSRHLR